MKIRFWLLAAGMSALLPGLASGDTLLGSYVARISANDHQASDGYPLDTAARMVRQDRANWHKFGSGDIEDEHDPWFGSAQARVRFEVMLNKSSAMTDATRRAIVRGEPVVEVQVYRQSVRVRIIGD
ncbi:hypothetical protein MesoLjLc_61180 [Mesorhizobium sp. L-8-10]|uniref:hypothetical protein n=1 Tax=unclassified Mesorhizobium TaxID=325217 RepID=UPI001928BB19|nr:MULTISPECIES: hypothetical protein [unclassified Mesorhizobium]BCH26204.1 hypothetical protein MesoLjLb_59890 [Mesorhizobium sp. L-8-3]BCH34188.1 hypothetical protein MesoLjLc_61180 [Mesorhizobium sp. L-8-10]